MAKMCNWFSVEIVTIRYNFCFKYLKPIYLSRADRQVTQVKLRRKDCKLENEL